MVAMPRTAVVDSPNPSSAGELTLILAAAFIATAPPQQAVNFVCQLAEAVREYEEGEVTMLSPTAARRVAARREAFAMLRRALPGYVANLSRDT